MRRTLVAGAVVGLVAALGLVAPAQAAPQTRPANATVGLFHGIPKVPVDVYVGSKRVVDDFQPGTFAGPLSLKAGTYTVRVVKATATNDRHPIIAPERVIVKSGGNYSVVAHLSAKGEPELSAYRNDLSRPLPGFGRVTVRHVAAAPTVDVLVNEDAAIMHVTNPHEAVAQVPAVTYDVAVALAGSKKPVLGPVRLDVAKRTNTIVYAWGSAKDGTLALAVRVLPTR